MYHLLLTTKINVPMNSAKNNDIASLCRDVNDVMHSIVPVVIVV